MTDCEWSLYDPSTTTTSNTTTIYYEPYHQVPTVGNWYIKSGDYVVNDEGTGGWAVGTSGTDWHEPRATPAEQAAAQQAAQTRWQIRAAANGNAQRLLHSVLSSGQRAMLDAHKKFFVRGQDGKMFEILTTKQHENIFLVNESGRRLKRFCIYQSGNTPLADNHAAQKLLLESNINLFYRIANVVTLS